MGYRRVSIWIPGSSEKRLQDLKLHEGRRQRRVSHWRDEWRLFWRNGKSPLPSLASLFSFSRGAARRFVQLEGVVFFAGPMVSENQLLELRGFAADCSFGSRGLKRKRMSSDVTHFRFQSFSNLVLDPFFSFLSFSPFFSRCLCRQPPSYFCTTRTQGCRPAIYFSGGRADSQQ